MGYTATVALMTGLVVGLVPALRVSRTDLDCTLRQSRHGVLSTHRLWIRGVLVTVQIAVCFVLLVAAGLFVRSLFEAERADLGFRPEGVHSYRSALTGSSCVARRAGQKHAFTDTTIITAAIDPIVTGSRALVSTSSVRSS